MTLIINLNYDASVNNAPAGFKAGVAAVAQFFENTFSDPISITIQVGYGEIGGQTLPSGALGESNAFLRSYSYSQLKNAIAANATSADDVSAAASLPSTAPANGGTYWVTQADAKALGLLGQTSGVDGYVGFSSTASFDYDDSNGVSSGQFDFFGTVAHEMTEVMGRILLAGATIGGIPNGYGPMDLFHYSGVGTRTLVGTQAGYFSPNGGTTSLGAFNTIVGGDFGDWASSVGNDSFRAFSSSGVVNAVTQNDIRVMDVIGYDLTPAPVVAAGSRVADDFNGDGTSDILWRNTSGAVVIYEMNGTQIVGGAQISSPDNSWQIAGVGDFNGDGKNDILWRNTNSSVVIYEMNGTQVIGGGQVSSPDNSWQIAGVGDFDGDGKSDILWRNTSGAVVIYEMNGTQIVGGGQVTSLDGSWQIAGIGDFNGDGKSDLLLRNIDGTVAIDEMNGTQIVGGGQVAQPDNSWHIVGTGDFNGDGKSDILWHNDNGTTAIYEMNGTQIVGGGTVAQPDTTWQIAGVADFNGDGKSDILWRNLNGSVVSYQMNGTQIASGGFIAQPDNSWQIAAA